MHSTLTLPSMVALALVATPLAARASAYPHFEEDAAPILRHEPGLLHYVTSRFDVEEIGTAKYPGDDDNSPTPPYIFRARPLGSRGPYNFRLLIQPGPPGHILNVVDLTKIKPAAPAATLQPPLAITPPQLAPVPAPAPTTPAPSSPSEPTSDTPSGPIYNSAAPTKPPLQPPSDPTPPSN